MLAVTCRSPVRPVFEVPARQRVHYLAIMLVFSVTALSLSDTNQSSHHALVKARSLEAVDNHRQECDMWLCERDALCLCTTAAMSDGSTSHSPWHGKQQTLHNDCKEITELAHVVSC